MATAMLPLFWPALRFDAARVSAPTDSPIAATSGQLQKPALKGARQAPTSNRNKKRKARRKRKKPAKAPLPAPDSTRLASSYKLPKIKIASKQSLGAQPSESPALPVGDSQSKQTQLQRALATLIAQQPSGGELATVRPPPTSVSVKPTSVQPEASVVVAKEPHEDRDLQTTRKPPKRRKSIESPAPSDAANDLRRHLQLPKADASNIKLFQFNKKLDARKLPFFKKPLNFSDTGELVLDENATDAGELARHRDEALAMLRELAATGRQPKRNKLDKLLAELSASANAASESESEPRSERDDAGPSRVEPVPVQRARDEPVQVRANQTAGEEPQSWPEVRTTSKPMVRVRRKHSHAIDAVWRPLEAVTEAPKLAQYLLVQSGLLTPSGSHVVPLFVPPVEAAREHTSGDEETPGRQPQPATRRSLLEKPQRPAKYSLNGYIPRPSLGDDLSASHKLRRRQLARGKSALPDLVSA